MTSAMGKEDEAVHLFLILRQLFASWFVFLTLITRFYVMFLSQKKHRRHMRHSLYVIKERLQAQIIHLHRIIEVGDVQCIVNLRMSRNSFARLCYLLIHVGGLQDSRYLRVEEKVAIFLSILAHHKKNRIIGHDYLRSGHTISTHFHEVLISVLKLHTILLVKPAPIDENCTNETWKWFKGCLGALDGTYITVHVSNKDKPRYRTRKGTTAINVLGVCNSEMKFMYALSGWEGSAVDARIIRDVVTRNDGLRIPRGCHYLCDNGYANVEGFLTPFRKTRYHMDDWAHGSIGPRNYKEYFNSKHCRACNVIERTFGLLKRRWAILRSPSFYPLKVHNRIIMACILLHNFIRSEMPNDPLEEVVTDTTTTTNEDVECDFIENIESSPAWDVERELGSIDVSQ